MHKWVRRVTLYLWVRNEILLFRFGRANLKPQFQSKFAYCAMAQEIS